MNEETRIKLRETRRQMMADLESSMLKGKFPEDRADVRPQRVAHQ